MADPRFFDRAGPFTLAALAELTGATLARGEGDARMVDVAALDQAGAEHLSFLDNRKYRDQFRASAAGACCVHPDFAGDAPDGMALLVSKTPYKAYALAAQAFYPAGGGEGFVHPAASVGAGAVLGEGCQIEAGAVIGAGAKLGARVRVAPNAVIGKGVEIGDDSVIGANASVSHALLGRRVQIYPGARIGQDGFGFAMDPAGHVRVPQLGRVIIEDDVEVGANSCIDRGAGPDTIIGRGTMIDNLVQIGHNVQTGPGCVLIAQVGVSGSTRLENHVVLAGQVGVTGHLTIGAGAQVAAQSGVMRDVPAGARLAGSPATPVKEHMRQITTLSRLARNGRASGGAE